LPNSAFAIWAEEIFSPPERALMPCWELVISWKSSVKDVIVSVSESTALGDPPIPPSRTLKNS
jgi:hypothetical protein